MFCGKCGQEMPDTAKFCPRCGAANPKAAQDPAPTPRPMAGGGMQLAENPFQLGLAACGLLQVILFFALSYGRLTSIGRLGFAMYGYEGSGRMTLPVSAKLMMISGKAGGEEFLAFIFSVIFYLPLLLGLAVLVLNLLSVMKLIKDIPALPVVSVVLSAATLSSHLVSRLMCFVGFENQGLAEFGAASAVLIAAVTAAQLVVGILALTKKTVKPVM